MIKIIYFKVSVNLIEIALFALCIKTHLHKPNCRFCSETGQKEHLRLYLNFGLNIGNI